MPRRRHIPRARALLAFACTLQVSAAYATVDKSTDTLSEPATRLLATLQLPELPPSELQRLERQTPHLVTDELMVYLATHVDPAPTAWLLGRAWAFAGESNRRAL